MQTSAHSAEPCHADLLGGLINRLAHDLAPSFATDTDDLTQARVLAEQTIAAYSPASPADVLNIARTISLSFAALATLRRVASEPMPAVLELRYLGLANTLNRSADQSEQTMQRRRLCTQPTEPPQPVPQRGTGVVDPTVAAVMHEYLAPAIPPPPPADPVRSHPEMPPEREPLRYRGAAPTSQWQRNLLQTTTMSSIPTPGLPPRQP